MKDIEAFIANIAPMQLLADVANGFKYLKLAKTTKTGDSATGVRRATFGGDVFDLQAAFEIESGGKTYDSVTVANDVLAAWDGYLRRIGLL